MSWKNVSESVANFLDDFLMEYPVEKQVMFGCPTYFYLGLMMCGVFQDGVFLRLSKEDKKK